MDNDNKKSHTSIGSVVFWQPTPSIRWKRVRIDILRNQKVLQQLWQSNKDEQEWRDVPEED